ncbi:hypothetical protein D9M68_772890 [compost metagenome]
MPGCAQRSSPGLPTSSANRQRSILLRTRLWARRSLGNLAGHFDHRYRPFFRAGGSPGRRGIGRRARKQCLSKRPRQRESRPQDRSPALEVSRASLFDLIGPGCGDRPPGHGASLTRELPLCNPSGGELVDWRSRWDEKRPRAEFRPPTKATGYRHADVIPVVGGIHATSRRRVQGKQPGDSARRIPAGTSNQAERSCLSHRYGR